MKKMKWNKRNTVLTALIALLMTASITATMAYLSDRPNQLINTFVTGNVTTEIEETFEQVTSTTFAKTPVIKNTGENDCYVRVRVVASPESALEITEWDTDNWTRDGEFYYYNAVLLAGVDAKTTPLFQGVQVTDTGIDGFEVAVYQEAVQTIVYASDGSFTTDMKKIWECYEQGSVPDSFQ